MSNGVETYTHGYPDGREPTDLPRCQAKHDAVVFLACAMVACELQCEEWDDHDGPHVTTMPAAAGVDAGKLCAWPNEGRK